MSDGAGHYDRLGFLLDVTVFPCVLDTVGLAEMMVTPFGILKELIRNVNCVNRIVCFSS